MARCMKAWTIAWARPSSSSGRERQRALGRVSIDFPKSRPDNLEVTGFDVPGVTAGDTSLQVPHYLGNEPLLGNECRLVRRQRAGHGPSKRRGGERRHPKPVAEEPGTRFMRLSRPPR